ncbi:MAG TPA: alpha/beta hydrolase [Rhizomicrobium sp.]|jgi:pimeloyl-ACP methyl ester carboxylesterase|nr:alpha/beta hydrolase [Rhizomicrobium sp.]
MMKLIPAFALLFLASAAMADDAIPKEGPAYGPQLEGYSYPFPLAHYRFQSQGVAMDMAYMDVRPTTPNGHAVVLLHGKNFCAATWEGSIRALSGAGYRVIAPDQIGWCKSTKPEHYQYTFEQLAANTHALLASLGITRAIVMGHSTGGMLAIRYGLLYPTDTERLVLVDPLGLEDWRAKGVPWQSLDAQYQTQLKTTADSIRDYERVTYYANTWKPEYEPWVQMLAGMYRGPGKAVVAWNSALAYDMIYTQPVFYEFEKLAMPVLLMIGDKDTTAPGKQLAPPELRAQLGHYPELAKAAVARMKQARLIEFPGLGHSPQIQDPAAFHQALLAALKP